jgi:thymidylate synthase (FAD)
MIEVTYVDHMGSDLSVVNAARVSFGKKSDWMPRVHNGEQLVLTPKDAKLISYLAKHKHKSPFNHSFVTFHVKAPIFVARQLQKHEYMPWNEISRRYVDSEPEFYKPEVWRGRSEDKKQGSKGVVTTLEWSEPDDDYDEYYPEDKKYLQPWQNYKDTPQNITKGLYNQVKEIYNILLQGDVSPEQARMVLPQSMMTEWYWSGSLYAFAKMCGLRLKPDAQYETRVVAEQIEDKMMELFPISWEALRMYEDCT